MSVNNNFTRLQFGVELEMLIRPRPECLSLLEKFFDFDNSATTHLPNLEGGNRDHNRDAICDFLAYQLAQNDLPARRFNEDQSDYSEWIIDGDPSIQE